MVKIENHIACLNEISLHERLIYLSAYSLCNPDSVLNLQPLMLGEESLG